MEAFKQISQSIRSHGRTTEGTSASSQDETGEMRTLQQLKALNLGNLDTLKDVFVTGLKGKPVDDKEYLMERVIKIMSELPVSSSSSANLTGGMVKLLWDDLQHPPISYLGSDYMYRKADGSNNNIRWPHLGQAGQPYARTVKPEMVMPVALPDPGVIFDSVLKRRTFREHPNKISSVLFYLASIIIHDIFHTDHADFTKSQTSSYLDLAPLYGSSQDEQNQMRTFKDGKLKADCFSDKRILGFPPGVGSLLIMFNRFHNWIVEQLALIDEAGRFSGIRTSAPPTERESRYDNALFQTGRLITGGLYVNIILKDYVRCILNLNRTNSAWDLDPRSEAGQTLLGKGIGEATGNSVSAEFNLVYRWHACVSQKDEKWSQEMFARISDGKEPKSQTDFLQQIGKWARGLPTDPQARPFADLQRTSEGFFEDDDLASIFTASVQDVAGSFGAFHTPEILRDVNILGIIQARSWNLASLNEFRKYFNLEPHKNFTDINPDPKVSEALEHLYGHPDHVEIYPGIVVESTKDALAPGSGLCTNFTISRAILSDAVALVRGDRFYTVDYTSKNLTNFGFEAANYDLAIDNGCVFYKLIHRALPKYFSYNSIYAHFPMVIPAENEKIMANLKLLDRYDFTVPRPVKRPVYVTSYDTCRSILSNGTAFAMANAADVAFTRTLRITNVMEKSIYLQNWQSQVASFYRQFTIDLLQQRSYTLASVQYIDLVTDLARPAQLHFAASILTLPLRSDHNPDGTYAEDDLYKVMASQYQIAFRHNDLVEEQKLQETLHQDLLDVHACLESTVEGIEKTGLVADLIDSLHRHDTLTDYGVQVIQRLLHMKSGLDIDTIVAKHMIPAAAALITQQSQAFVECLNYYLSDKGSVHLSEIYRLAHLDTAEADKKIERYLLEGTRLACNLNLGRKSTVVQSVSDKGQTIGLTPGQTVFCDLQLAFQDSKVFPDPLSVDLDRDDSLYSFYGWGHYGYLDNLSRVALTTMLKTVGKLKNLRRAAGPQGHLKTVKGPRGLVYMNSEQSCYSPFPGTMKICFDPLSRPSK
jgi:linoleate 8R-lipoxygenase/9,12-octadecadienoate 8-hydroperoxide 8R-isomerase